MQECLYRSIQTAEKMELEILCVAIPRTLSALLDAQARQDVFAASILEVCRPPGTEASSFPAASVLLLLLADKELTSGFRVWGLGFRLSRGFRRSASFSHRPPVACGQVDLRPVQVGQNFTARALGCKLYRLGRKTEGLSYPKTPSPYRKSTFHEASTLVFNKTPQPYS